MLETVATVLSSTIILLVGGLHFYWAAGGKWPGTDHESLVAMTMGRTPPFSISPSPISALAGLAFVTIAWVVLAAAGMLALDTFEPYYDIGRLGVLFVFALRGVGGFLFQRVLPLSADVPFVRLNRQFYSPLCLVVAGLVAIAVAAAGFA